MEPAAGYRVEAGLDVKKGIGLDDFPRSLPT